LNRTRAFIGPLVILAVALCARLVLWSQEHGHPAFEIPVLDERFYLTEGRAIAGGDGREQRPFFMSPAYTLFAALLLRVDSDGRALVLAQIVIDSLTCVLAGILAKRLGPRGAGWIAGLLLALLPCAMLQSTRILPESLAALFGVLFLLAWPTGAAPVRAWRFAAAGACLGTMTIMRSNTLLFFPVAAVLVMWCTRARPGRVVLGSLCAFGLGGLLLIGPVTAYNRVVGKDWVLINSSGGVNFFIGNARGNDGRFQSLNHFPLAPGAFDDDPTENRFERSVQAFAERVRGRPLRPSEMSAFWSELAVKEIRADFPGFCRLLLRKAFLFFNAFEIPQIDNLYFLDRHASVLGPPLQWLSRILWPLALIGLCAGVVGRWFGPVPTAFFATYALSVVLFFVNARFRTPVLPVAAVFAGVALARCLELLGSRRLSAIGAAALLIISALICNLNPALGLPGESGPGSWFVPSAELLDFESQHNNLAARILERPAPTPEELAIADRECELGLELNPTHPTLMFNRARVRFLLHDHESAENLLAQSLSLQPGNSFAVQLWCETIRSCLKEGRWEDGIRSARAAAGVLPGEAQFWNLLGACLQKAGHAEEAIEAFRQGLRAQPSSFELNFNLALALQTSGRADQAADLLEPLYRQNPGNEGVANMLAMCLFKLHRIDEAEEVVRRLLAQSPDHLGGLLTLAEILIERKDAEAARPLILRALAQSPGSKRAQDLLSRIGGN